tara:strand:- start:125 stop:805 length:681 start_codon:yes stop_codon:yes gene_type:complete
MNKNSVRYEKKYIVPFKNKSLIYKFLISSKMRFTPQYEERVVNSIYLDTSKLQFFYENIYGLSRRRKFRIRWYGNPDYITNPVLEVKLKNGNLGRKIILPIYFYQNSNFIFDIKQITKSLKKINASKNLSETLKYLKPNLFVSYTRTYFKSKELECRLTIDREIKYRSINIQTNSMQNLHNNKNLIMELKYPFNIDSKKLSSLFNFPIRITKNSKYIEGIRLSQAN